MGKDSKKVTKWEDLDEERRNKLTELRTKELELLEHSGSNKIIKYFYVGYGSYSIFLLAYIKLKHKKLNNASLVLMVGPIIPYLFCLTKLFGNVEKYKEYFQVRAELNQTIKKSSKSSEYK